MASSGVRGAALLLLTGLVFGVFLSHWVSGEEDEPVRDGGTAMRVQSKPSHPFLFFNSDDVPHMRRKAATTHRRYFDDLKAWADAFIDCDPIDPDSLSQDRDVLQIYYENAAPYVINMSLLYHLTGEDVYAEAARKWLLTLCRYPSETRGGYFIGAYATAVAGGYDMLYDRLADDEKALVRGHLTALVERGLRGVTTDWWAGISLHHDHWLPITGLGVGAVALYGEAPESAAWLERLVDIFKDDVAVAGDDGAWMEGTGNWVYAMGLTYVFCEAYRNLTGEDLFDLPLIRNGSLYRIYSWLPNDTYVYHHDSHANGRYNVMGSASCHLLRKLAAEHRDGYAQWLADREERHDVARTEPMAPHPDWKVKKAHIVPMLHCVGWNFLWYDPTVEPRSPADLPLYRYFPNQGLIVVRSGWSVQDVVFSFTCAPPGGHRGHAAVAAGDERMGRGISHIHAQANSFDLFANGNYLVPPPGYGERSSERHSTLTLKGADQRLNPKYPARVLRHDFQADYAYFAGDATECYPEEIGLERWYRHVVFLPPNVFLVCDELAASEPLTSEPPTTWRLNFHPLVNEAIVDNANQAVTIRPASPGDDKGALWARLLQPEGLQLEAAVLRHPTRGYVRFGQVQAHLPAGQQPKAQILAALVALPNARVSPPAIRLIEGEGLVGAVVDGEGESRCALILLDGAERHDGFALRASVEAQAEITCYVFSLAPNSGYDVSVSSRAADGGLAAHTISVKQGTGVMTNGAGTLVIRTAAERRAD